MDVLVCHAFNSKHSRLHLWTNTSMTMYFILQVICYSMFVFIFGVHGFDVVRKAHRERDWSMVIIPVIAYGGLFSVFFYLMFLV